MRLVHNEFVGALRELGGVPAEEAAAQPDQGDDAPEEPTALLEPRRPWPAPDRVTAKVREVVPTLASDAGVRSIVRIDQDTYLVRRQDGTTFTFVTVLQGGGVARHGVGDPVAGRPVDFWVAVPDDATDVAVDLDVPQQIAEMAAEGVDGVFTVEERVRLDAAEVLAELHREGDPRMREAVRQEIAALVDEWGLRDGTPAAEVRAAALPPTVRALVAEAGINIPQYAGHLLLNGRALYLPDETRWINAARAMGADPDGAYTFDARWGSHGPVFGDQELSVADVANLIRNDPQWEGQPVRFWVCLSPEFARQLARELGVPVTSPTAGMAVWSLPDGRAFVASIAGYDATTGLPIPTQPHDGALVTWGPDGNAVRVVASEQFTDYNLLQVVARDSGEPTPSPENESAQTAPDGGRETGTTPPPGGDGRRVVRIDDSTYQVRLPDGRTGTVTVEASEAAGDLSVERALAQRIAAVATTGTSAVFTAHEQGLLARGRVLTRMHSGGDPQTRLAVRQEIAVLAEALRLLDGTPEAENRRLALPAEVRAVVDDITRRPRWRRTADWLIDHTSRLSDAANSLSLTLAPWTVSTPMGPMPLNAPLYAVSRIAGRVAEVADRMSTHDHRPSPVARVVEVSEEQIQPLREDGESVAPTEELEAATPGPERHEIQGLPDQAGLTAAMHAGVLDGPPLSSLPLMRQVADYFTDQLMRHGTRADTLVDADGNVDPTLIERRLLGEHRQIASTEGQLITIGGRLYQVRLVVADPRVVATQLTAIEGISAAFPQVGSMQDKGTSRKTRYSGGIDGEIGPVRLGVEGQREVGQTLGTTQGVHAGLAVANNRDVAHAVEYEAG